MALSEAKDARPMGQELRRRLITCRSGMKLAWNWAIPSLSAFYARCVSGGNWGSSLQELSDYWRAYGGFKAVFKSPWLWIAFVVTLICTPLWRMGDWAATALGVLPNLLGFSLGAMAIVLAFPSASVFKMFAEKGRPDSYYIDVASRFVHFVIVQVTAITLALVAKAWLYMPLNLLGFWAFCYAIATAAATALSLYGIARIYNASESQPNPEDDQL
jgi:hypothetical protein